LATDLTLRPPVAPVRPTRIVTHGDERVDPYFWMRDRDDPDLIPYLEAENAYAEAVTAHTAGLRERLYEEIKGRTKETDSTAPVRYAGWLYYTRTVEGLEYPISCRKRGSMDAEEEVILDVNALAAGHDYFSVGAAVVSPDHALLAYTEDVDGSERFVLRVKDLATGALLDERIESVSWSLAWAQDRTLYYTVQDDAKRPYKLLRHRLGADPAADEVIHHEADEGFFCYAERSSSGRFVYLSLVSNQSSEWWVLDAGDPNATKRLIAERRPGEEYYLTDQGERFLIRTNDGAATNFRLIEAPRATPGREHWRELLPADEAITLESVLGFADHVVLLRRDNGIHTINVERVSTGERHVVEMPESNYVAGLEPALDYDTVLLQFSYESMVTPPSWFEYDMATRDRTLLKQQEVLGGYDPSAYRAERLDVTARDGTVVPMSIVYRAGIPRDGSNPALLYAYGSYGITIEPGFNAGRVSLLDRGFVYAIAHVRGGGFLGERWRKAGKLLEKKNTFTDFVDCAERLVADGYTSADRLAIQGGSAGGLLMGAVLNMRPDLFAVVVAQVPFVDVINTMLDSSIPLTVIEYDEWGNPNDPTFYEYMRSYSPYDNVRAAAYPHLLVMSGLNDPRVQYWEPAKWVALLRTRAEGSGVIVHKVQMGAGHGGPSGRYERMRETAYVFAFVLDRLSAA